jgi:hypothetical protein
MNIHVFMRLTSSNQPTLVPVSQAPLAACRMGVCVLTTSWFGFVSSFVTAIHCICVNSGEGGYPLTRACLPAPNPATAPTWEVLCSALVTAATSHVASQLAAALTYDMAMTTRPSAISVAAGCKSCQICGCIKLLGSFAIPQLLYFRLVLLGKEYCAIRSQGTTSASKLSVHRAPPSQA